MTLPILYSFRRCPYAMRARLALMHCGAQYSHREVLLKDKPVQLLEISSKGTVPVLIVPIDDNNESESATHSNNDNNSSSNDNCNCNCNGSSSSTTSYRVIDESIDIMHWAMNENPSRHSQNSTEWLSCETMSANDINALIARNDFEFKDQLDKYKYSDRYPEHSQTYYLEQAMPFLETLEGILTKSPYLGGRQFRFPDAAILPFVRQFSMVQPKQFNALPLPKLQQWLANGLESDLFVSVMYKFPQWQVESQTNSLPQ